MTYVIVRCVGSPERLLSGTPRKFLPFVQNATRRSFFLG